MRIQFHSPARAAVWALWTVLSLHGPALATTITTVDATNKEEATIFVRFHVGPANVRVDVKIPPKTPAAEKARLIAVAVNEARKKDKRIPAATSAENKVRFPKGTKLEFSAQKTGEKQDQVTAAAPRRGGFGFDNPYWDPYDADGALAVFTGGFETDLGPLFYTIASNELPDTSGDAIASMLFALLLPDAARMGVALELAGSGVNMTFDTRLVTNGGVIWGTTSLTDGSYGYLEPVPEPRTGGIVLGGLLLAALGLAGNPRGGRRVADAGRK